jgi:hypothetical protein
MFMVALVHIFGRHSTDRDRQEIVLEVVGHLSQLHLKIGNSVYLLNPTETIFCKHAYSTLNINREGCLSGQ